MAARLFGTLWPGVPRMTPPLVGGQRHGVEESADGGGRLGDAEVEDLDGAVSLTLILDGFIAMDDAALVRRVERVGNLAGDRARVLERHCAVQQTIGERRAFDELEHQGARASSAVGRAS